MFSVQTVRLYPTREQSRTLDSWMATARRVWNNFLEHRIKIWKRRGERTRCFAQQKMLTIWRANDDRVRHLPQKFGEEALDRLDKAFDAFFRRVKNGEKPGFPRFKGKGRWNSLNYRQANRYIYGDRIAVPKLGLIRCRNLRPIDGVIESLRVIKRADRWFAQLLIDDGKPVPEKIPIQSSVGIDVGLDSFATFSDGVQIDNPRVFRKMERKLRRANKSLARKQRGSKRRLKAKKRLARVHLKIADRRRDFTHKLSKAVVQTYDLIAVENLNIVGMARSRFGKSIADAAWSQFTNRIAYKAEKAGKTFVRVDPRGTSIDCSQCGNRCPKTLNDREHNCPACGLSLDRDINAARNILSRAVPGMAGEVKHAETPIPGGHKAVGKGRRGVKV